jgi:Rrf2 family transcriptional regulator, iron-sulfur cluster assembly transcription factor
LKVVRPIWMQLQDDCMARLDEITIEDLCLRANQAGIESESHSKIDFSI